MSGRTWLVASAAALALTLLGCGGGDGGDAAADDAAATDCAALAASAVNGFDLVGVVASDGLDAAERQQIESELARAREEHPELVDGGRCADALQVEGLESQVDRHRLAVLRAMGSATFTSIPPESKAPEPVAATSTTS